MVRHEKHRLEVYGHATSIGVALAVAIHAKYAMRLTGGSDVSADDAVAIWLRIR